MSYIFHKDEDVKRRFVTGLEHLRGEVLLNAAYNIFETESVTMADVMMLLDLIDKEAKRMGSEVVSWTIEKSEYQGMQGISEVLADQRMQTAFAEGSGTWRCLRFGDGDKTYELTLREVG